MICLASQFCIFANLHHKTPRRHNCGKWVPAKSCDLHKLLSGPHFPAFRQNPDSSSGKRPRRVRSKSHLFHIRPLFLSPADVIAGYDRPHLPFLSLIKARTGWEGWIRDVDWGVALQLCKLPSFSPKPLQTDKCGQYIKLKFLIYRMCIVQQCCSCKIWHKIEAMK